MFDRTIAIGLTLACGVLALVLYRNGVTNPRTDKWVDPARLTPETKNIPDASAILDRKIPVVQFDGMPAHRVFLKLGEIAHANIAVRWDSLLYASLPQDNPVTLRLENVTLREALSTLISQLERGSKEHLGFALIDQIITVSTYGDFDAHPVSMAYNIRDLITRLKSNGENSVQAIDHIIREITASVAPETWRDYGGTLGTVREFGGLLLVSQTVEHQAEVEELLDKLRRAGGRRLVNPSAIAPVTGTVPRSDSK